VPYRGSPQALTDLLGKRIDFMLDPPAAHLEPIKDGRLRALAVTGSTRFFALPDVPTMAEARVPDFVVSSWQGLMGPAGLPALIAERISKEVAAVLADAAVVEKLKLLGNEAKASSPDAFKARVVADIEKWNQVVAAANIERI
jgi:tripartite-type tricarboxylate transporter receptor subunit TctC